MHKLTMMWVVLSLVGLVVGANVRVEAAALGQLRGSPAVQFYEMQKFDGASMNTAVLQLADGRLLVANQRGLFRFDGGRWHLNTHPQQLGGMEHLALDAAGRIYTSFDGDVGYFAPDASDALQWHSLLARIPASTRLLSEVLMLQFDRSANTLWFATPRHLYQLPINEAQAARVMAFPTNLHAGCLSNNSVLLQTGANWQLQRLNVVAWQLESVPGAEHLNQQKLARCQPDPRGGTLLATYQGAIAHDRDEAITPLADLRTEIGASSLRDALLLRDGRIVLGRGDSTLLLLDPQGTVLDRYGVRDGIPGLRRLNGLFQDHDGDVWLAQELTISKISLTRAVTQFDASRGLPAANDVERWQGDLYASNTTGLYRLDADAESGGAFVRVLDKVGALRGMAKLDDDTLIVFGTTAFAVHNDQNSGLRAHAIAIQGPATIISAVESSPFTPGRVWLGSERGLYALQRAGAAIQVTPIAGFDRPVFKLAEIAADTLMVADRLDGVWRVDAKGVSVPKHYGEAAGLPKGQVRIYPGPQRPWFTTMMGLRVFDAVADRFVVPPGLPLELQQDRLFSAYEDHEHNLWVRGGAIENDVFWREGEGWRADHVLFGVFEPFPTIFSFMREGNLVWAVRANGLLRFDLTQHQPLGPAPVPVLSSLLDTRAKTRLPISNLPLAVEQRDLRLEFALPVLHRPEATRYRSRLLGYESEWSDWGLQDATDRIYTNLPDGAFELQVEASDSYRRTTKLNYSLRLPAPWYRTSWAIAGAGLLLLSALFVAARFGSSHRKRLMLVRQLELESTVAERTRELAQKNQQLAEQAGRLAEVDRLKTRFFINVGHEFRTPLSLVLGPIDDLLRDTRERFSVQARQQLQMAQRNAKRVLDLIVELLDVNRFEHGQLTLRCAPNDLVALLHRVAQEARALTARHGHELQLDCGGFDQAVATIDPLQIERALNNLIGNAAKYMARGGVISLQLQRVDADWLVSVSDQGRGIAPEALPHVFDRFFQADGAAQASGYGIGLSLVREIALAHGGSVTVSSELGVGSRFTLLLAASVGAPEVHFAAPADATSPSSASAASEIPDAKRGRERVLVVDDHDDMRLRVRALLQPRFEVLEAADGNAAWQLARDELPDLIVSDVMMPGCDGVDLTRRVRAHSDTQTIGVLLLTAKVGSDHAVAGLNAGANDYLAKPFDASELLARCEAIVGHARRLQHRVAAAAPAASSAPIADGDARWRQRLDEQIQACLHDADFGVEALAQTLFTDRTNLFRRCKDLLGISPSDYLRDARLAHGHQLLERGAGNVSEVAYASGFESLSSFTRAFKARYGLPPSQVKGQATS